jgi:DNA-binding NarL/FixJ family response regulator
MNDLISHSAIPIRTFLVDDHPIVCSGLKALIERQPDMLVVGEADDGVAAEQGVASLLPNVVVMDLMLPRLGGIRATERIKASFPEVKVVALTASDEPTNLQGALRAGASCVMLKRTAADELVHAIRCVAQGGVYPDPRVDDVLSRQGVVPEAPPRAALSERETEVLKLLAAGFTAKEMAARLCISVRTLETYRARAMEKLALKSRADIVRYAAQRDWLPTR